MCILDTEGEHSHPKAWGYCYKVDVSRDWDAWLCKLGVVISNIGGPGAAHVFDFSRLEGCLLRRLMHASTQTPLMLTPILKCELLGEVLSVKGM